ncbi:hypothetical protein SCARR_01787 [Pontiella sulfatireligans]|uniref:Uncharacterized protein n=1 Tax=Pontiella sulfatireligans TaxID=2750658 RepID=A0A6C2UHW7_9BACT|nr:hypothetical protein SCARR_01787 [Pontiella sulfatireligans]
MPCGLDVPETMAQSEAFAKKYHSVSIIPEIRVTGLPGGLLSLSSYKAPLDTKTEASKGKRRRKKNK